MIITCYNIKFDGHQSEISVIGEGGLLNFINTVENNSNGDLPWLSSTTRSTDNIDTVDIELDMDTDEVLKDLLKAEKIIKIELEHEIGFKVKSFDFVIK